MSFTDKLNDSIKKAMLAKDSVRLAALRAVKSAVLLEQTSGKGPELTEDDFFRIVNKLIKQRQDSIAIYQEQKRPDLVEEESAQLAVIKEFLPPQMSDEEILSVLKDILSENGIREQAQFGRAMGLASKKLAGKADNKRISDLLRALLKA